MKYWQLLVLAVVLLSACTSQLVADPTRTPTHAESITPWITEVIPLLTLQEPTIELPTETPNTLGEVVIPSEFVGDGLTEDGPWLLLSIDNNLWALNADGTGLTELSNGNLDLSWWVLETKISPSGKYVAALDTKDNEIRLNLISLPSGDYKTLTPLINLDDPSWSSWAVSTSDWSVSWSPDGKYLAFIAKMDQPSADVYIYDIESEKITRLTWGEYDAFYPTWSPDSKYILHAAGWHGTGAGHYMAEVWASRVSDRKNIFIYNPWLIGSSDETFIGWKDNETFLVTTWRIEAGDSDFRSVNILTGATRHYWKDWLHEVEISPETSTAILVDIVGLDQLIDIVLINLDTNTSSILFDDYETYGWASINQFQWSSELIAYIFNAKEGITTISPEGEIYVYSNIESFFFPEISVDGIWAWGDNFPGIHDYWEREITGLWVGYPEGEHIQIFDKKIIDVVWSPDGSRLFFLASETSINLYMAESPKFEPILIARGFPVVASWSPQDMAWATP